MELDLDSIRERVKLFRSEHLKISQKELSESIELDQSTYSKIEKGDRAVSITLILKLFYKYNLDLFWVLTGKGQMVFLKGRNDNSGQNGMMLDIHGEPRDISQFEEDFIKLSMTVMATLEIFKEREIPLNPHAMAWIILTAHHASVTGNDIPEELKRKIEEKLKT